MGTVLIGFILVYFSAQNVVNGIVLEPKDKSQNFLKMDIQNIPVSFDARNRWPMCKTISRIRDQGKCGSCWAVAASSVMSDRYCIFAQRNNVIISNADIVNCCEDCAINPDNGCEGGYVSGAFQYWLQKGVVTESCSRNYGKKGTCSKQCDTNLIANYRLDRNFGNQSYDLSQNVTEIQLDILVNGPVVARVAVFEDFYLYTEGVYQNQEGFLKIGNHSVRLIGWGVEGETDYWLVANSFGTNWGNDGLIKILRGVNHLGIESAVTAGIPKNCEIIKCDTVADNIETEDTANKTDGSQAELRTQLMPDSSVKKFSDPNAGIASLFAR